MKHDVYWQMYFDIWDFHKRYINGIDDSDEFWDCVVRESMEITAKYGQCKFIVNLMLNELFELERIYKERDGKMDD
jgi:nickel-dependent lactate racemase